MGMYQRLLFGLCSIGLILSSPVAQSRDFVDVLTQPGKIILKESRRLFNPVAPHAKKTKRKVASATTKKPIARTSNVASKNIKRPAVPATVTNASMIISQTPAEAKEVAFINRYKIGTIVINANTGVLYFVDSNATARRYSIFTGKDVRGLHGEATLKSKAKWPDWLPGLDLLQADPRLYANYKNGVSGGPESPFGARALYLSRNDNDNLIVIHGTTNLLPLKTSASDFGIRMKNELVIDLFERVSAEALVVIL
jgi:lipoprotein-anchoring transpeptidase ErfK/SrfK